jgi:prepilin-type N-terminal cleavage/methylation domain-containing protein
MLARSHSGFTIIELSIVLVIIGLLVGGVLVGRDLIAQAQYRNQINYLTEIKTAHYAFMLKYNCIPGDCSKTSNFFSQIIGLDGNNNGRVECWYGGSTVDECRSYFYSLRLAGLWEGTQGSSTPLTEYYKSKLRNSIMYVNFEDHYDGHPFQSTAFVHLITINAPWAFGAVISSADARQMDVKLDDGKASTGAFLGIDGGDSLGNTLACLNAGEYDLTQTANNCRVDYKIH